MVKVVGMEKGYKILGNYIRVVDERNKNLAVTKLLGVSISKKFIPSIANIVGTDLSNYKIVRTGQFAYGPVTSRNGEKISIAYLDEEDCIISSSYTVFEVENKEELDPEYLMLWFSRPEFDRYARYKSHGSVREIFDWNELCMVELPVPDIEKQRKIVKAYKTITDRIDLKQKINDNLEATASAMFKERFSIERANPEWLVGTLQDLYTFQYGKGNNNPDNDGVYPVYGSNGIIGGYDEYNNEDAPVIGHIGINCGSLVFAFGKHFVTYNGVMCNVNNPKNKYFGYLTLANSRLQAHVRGSSQPFVSYDMLYEIKAVLPPSEVIEQFEKQVTPLFEQVSSNQREIKHLLELQTIQLARLAN